MWTITIWSFIDLVLLIVFAPETYAPVILAKKAKERLDNNEAPALQQAKQQPEHHSLLGNIISNSQKIPLLLLYEPMLTILCIWTGLLLAIIYAFFEIFRE